MRKGFWGISIASALALLVISSAAVLAQRARNKPAATAPAANDLKITYRTTTSGQSTETTTMLKGARERSEMKLGQGMDIINVTQCDLKRSLQISDSARKYVITPMETGNSSAPTGAVASGTSEPSRRGGVITYTTTSVDTGERKEMFGFQARHIKRTIVMESSPDACMPMKMRMETDGWYIDFSFGLNCEVGRQQMMGGAPAGGGCRDSIRFNQQGAARTGYALAETTTSYGPDGSVSFTSTKEVVDLSREPLDAALFDVPAGYLETKNAQELYTMPSMDAMTSQAATGRPSVEDDQNNASVASDTKGPGVIRVGVVQINNRTDRAISANSLRDRLISNLEGDGINAIALHAISPGAAIIEAKAKQCDFILYTDITALKISAAKKLGGVFGRAAGVSGIDKTEAKVEFQLFVVSDNSPRLKSAASAKEEGDEASAGVAIDQEARAVSAEARKKRVAE